MARTTTGSAPRADVGPAGPGVSMMASMSATVSSATNHRPHRRMTNLLGKASPLLASHGRGLSPGPWSDHQLSAIDADHLAGGIAAGRAQEEEHRVGDLGRLA